MFKRNVTIWIASFIALPARVQLYAKDILRIHDWAEHVHDLADVPHMRDVGN
jgi:hypothetical protein